jgi:hypothetical protein
MFQPAGRKNGDDMEFCFWRIEWWSAALNPEPELAIAAAAAAAAIPAKKNEIFEVGVKNIILSISYENVLFV